MEEKDWKKKDKVWESVARKWRAMSEKDQRGLYNRLAELYAKYEKEQRLKKK